MLLVEWWRGRRELWMGNGGRVGEIGQSSLTRNSFPYFISRNIGIPRMDLDTEETCETHNLYIERIRGSLKNIVIFFI